jgi:hypothetical protein
VKRTALVLATLVVGIAAVGTGSASPATAGLGVDMSCYAPAGDPEPGTAAWTERDIRNQYCASLRPVDQAASPAFGFGNLSQGASARPPTRSGP